MDYEIMGTKNKAVTAYLPADVEARLAAYCIEQGLSRQGKKSGKEKPALGTAIVAVLRTFFGTNTDGKGIQTEIDQKAIEAIVNKKLSGNVLTEAWVKAEIELAIAALRDELKADTDVTKTEITSKARETEIKAKARETELKAKEPKPEKNSGLSLNQADLSRRLRSNPSTLSRHVNKGEAHFAQWSKAKDPDRLAWKFTEVKDKSKFFAPIK